MCFLSYKIWKTLKVTHKGTNQVKKTKINMLVLFKIDANKYIVDRFSRFTNILNIFKKFRNVYSTPENVRKFLGL